MSFFYFFIVPPLVLIGSIVIALAFLVLFYHFPELKQKFKQLPITFEIFIISLILSFILLASVFSEIVDHSWVEEFKTKVYPIKTPVKIIELPMGCSFGESRYSNGEWTVTVNKNMPFKKLVVFHELIHLKHGEEHNFSEEYQVHDADFVKQYSAYSTNLLLFWFILWICNLSIFTIAFLKEI